MRIGFISEGTRADFKFARKHGFPCIEFNVSDRDHSVAKLLAQRGDLLAWQDRYGIAVSQIGLFGVDHTSGTAAVRDLGFDQFRAVADLARELGARIITTGGGHPRGDLGEELRRFFEFMPRLIDEAQARGMVLALYNCPWGNFVVGPEAWGPIFDKYPMLGIKFDPSHPIHAGMDWKVQLRDWGAKVVHGHIKDTLFIDGAPFEDVPAGMGGTDWGGFLALLYHHNYTGDLNIEPHSATWRGARLHDGIRIARDHLWPLLAPGDRKPKD